MLNKVLSILEQKGKHQPFNIYWTKGLFDSVKEGGVKILNRYISRCEECVTKKFCPMKNSFNNFRSTK